MSLCLWIRRCVGVSRNVVGVLVLPLLPHRLRTSLSRLFFLRLDLLGLLDEVSRFLLDFSATGGDGEPPTNETGFWGCVACVIEWLV